ncbi:ribonuclease HI [Campylobacter sp. MOP7]|uniref:ribonuclease HI n=1 Tax=Campylobacter canis TaxID=3378588 RepID=UPI00387E56A9
MKRVELHTDGSCLGNPGIGGWAYILVYNSFATEGYGSQAETTNNQMEIKAVLEGLKKLIEPCDIVLYTDSEYVANSINTWMAGWLKRQWKNTKNVEMWKEYVQLMKRGGHKLEAKWVKGHNGHPQNERCDQLARKAAETLKDDLKRQFQYRKYVR